MTNIDLMLKNRDFVNTIDPKKIIDFLQIKKKTADEILSETIEKSNIFFGFDVTQKSQKENIIRARFMSIAHVMECNFIVTDGNKKKYNIKIVDIAKAFGNKHHATINNAIQQHKNFIDYDDQYKYDFLKFKKFINENK